MATTAPRKSILQAIGEAAMRAALLDALIAEDWSLKRVAERLQLASGSNVIRQIRILGLSEHYEAAKNAGKIRLGPRVQRSQ